MVSRNSGTRATVDGLANSAPKLKRKPLVTKNTGMNTPNAAASSFSLNWGWVVWSRSISERRTPAANAPRIVSSPNWSASAANPIINTNAARTRICAVVSWSRRRTCERPMDLSTPRDCHAHQGYDQPEHADQDQRPGGAARALAREEQRQQDDRAELRDRGRREHELTEARAGDVRVLQDREDHADRRGGEHDRDEERRLDESAGFQAEAEGDRDRERERESDRGQLEDRALQALDVDLQAGEEQQERQSDQSEGRDGQVGVGPPQPGWADDDAEHELEHDRRQAESREETERERGEQADRDDDQQVCVVHSGHVETGSRTSRSVPLAPRQTQGSPLADQRPGLASRRDRGMRLAGLPGRLSPGGR